MLASERRLASAVRREAVRTYTRLSYTRYLLEALLELGDPGPLFWTPITGVETRSKIF